MMSSFSCVTRYDLPCYPLTYDISIAATTGRTRLASRRRQSLPRLPFATLRRQVVIRILVDRQPVVRARQHRPKELLGAGGLERVAVGPQRGGLFHLLFATHAGHHHHWNLLKFRI